MKQRNGWPAEWSEQIGRAVARHRKLRGMSAQALSDRCADLGFPIPRNTITNLENGRKESVPVHEVWVLARALDVAAIDLLFPMATEDGLAPNFRGLLPNSLWFAYGVEKPWEHKSEFAMYERHEFNFMRAFGRVFREGASEDWIASGVAFLADTRDEMAARGLPLPSVPPEVAWWLESNDQGIPRYKLSTLNDEEREAWRQERMKGPPSGQVGYVQLGERERGSDDG